MNARAAQGVTELIEFDQVAESAPEISVNDRRKYVARIPIEIPLRLASCRFSAAAITLDISVTGLQVRTRLPLSLNERVILTFQDEETPTPLSLCAEVVRIISDPETDGALPSAADDMAGAFSKIVRLSGNNNQSQAPTYGLRVLRDDGAAWQNFVRVQVLS